MWGNRHHIVYVKILFWVITCSLLALRVWFLNAYQFTYDECSALERSIHSSWTSFWNFAVKPDAHPFLLQAYTVVMVKVFGYSAMALKLPMVLISILNVFLAFKIGERISHGSGYLLSAFFTASFIIVYYASIARMYTPGLCFTLVLIVTSIDCLQKQNIRWHTYGLWIISAWALASIHHMGALLVLTLIPILLFKVPQVHKKTWGITLVITLLLYMPQLPITWHQFHHNGIGPKQGGWLDPPHWSMMLKWVKVVLGTGYTAWGIGAIALWMFWKSRKRISVFGFMFGLVLALLNMLIIYGYSVWRAPIMQYSVLLFSGVGFLLVLAECTKGLHYNSRVVIGLAVLIMLGIQTFYVKAMYPQHLKSAYEEPYTILKQYQTNHISALFCNSEPFINSLFTSKYKLNTQHVFPVALNADTKAKSTWLSQQKTPFILLASPLPADLERVKMYYPYIKTHVESASVNWYVLSRKPQHTSTDGNNTISAENWPQLTNSTITAQHLLAQNSFTAEFPLTLQKTFASNTINEGDVLFAQAHTDTVNNALLELCIVLKCDTQTIAYASANSYNGKIFTQLYIGSWIKAFEGKSLTRAVYLWNRNFKTHQLNYLRTAQLRYWPQHWTIWD